MSILALEIGRYSSVDTPDVDSVTIGDAVDFTKCVAFYGIAPAGTAAMVSNFATNSAAKMPMILASVAACGRWTLFVANGNTGERPMSTATKAAFPSAHFKRAQARHANCNTPTLTPDGLLE
jgi:hypothetical protein